MTNLSQKDIDLLAKLMPKQLELFEKYLTEITAQTEYIEFDDDEGLTASVEQQGRIVDEIDKLHKKTAPLILAYKEAEKSGGEDDKCPIAIALARIKAILKEASETNEQNIKAATGKKAEYSELISKLSKDKKGISGYTQKITETSDLFDKKQ